MCPARPLSPRGTLRHALKIALIETLNSDFAFAEFDFFYAIRKSYDFLKEKPAKGLHGIKSVL